MRAGMVGTVAALCVAAWLAGPAPVRAQQPADPEEGLWGDSPSGGATGGAGGGARARGRARGGGGGGGGGGDVRLAFEARLDALNVIILDEGSGVTDLGEIVPITPLITTGVRLLDTRLFLGLGVGFFNLDGDANGFSLSPVVSYDFLSTELAALYFLGVVNLGQADIDPGDDVFVFGMDLGIGLRGKINEALAIGTEWGWGFGVFAFDNADNQFHNGFFGALMFEASIGL